MNVNHSLGLLDLYCRRDQIKIAESLYKNKTGTPLNQIIPIKQRCGSLNPYKMHPNDVCHCENEKEISQDGSSKMIGNNF